MTAAAVVAVVGVSAVRADPLIPGLELPPIQLIGEAPAAPETAQRPPDVAGGSSVPDACTGGVLRPGGELQRFADSLEAGETGCLRRGVYAGGVDLRRRNITLRSYPGARATISGGQVRISARATGAAVRKLRLVSDELSPLIYASRATIADSEITNGHTAICVHLDQYPGAPPPTGVTIARNRIHDCGLLPAGNRDHGIYIAAASGTVIRDNLIYDNADRGVQLYPQAEGTKILDNVIDGNGQGVIFGGASDGTVVRGNIISNSNVRHNIESSESTATNNVVRDNCLWSTQEGWYGGVPPRSGVIPDPVGFSFGSNKVADPRFGDRHDFIPARSSPCRAMGPAADRGSR